jgi:HD-GYP domain-containing protein (c-di-GMP phosphodiesterase class II)
MSDATLRHPRAFRLYYALVVVAGGVLLALAWRPDALARPAVLGLALLVMIVSEAGPVSLPSGGYATASAVLDLACLVILGPLATALLDIASTLVVQGLLLRKPFVRVVHNMAIFALTALAAGQAFLAAGGRPGTLALPRDVVPLLVCGGTYFLCNSAFVSTVIGLTQGPNPWRVWQRNFQQGIFHHLSFITLGALVAVAWYAAGPWGLALFAIPFLVARHSFGMYMEIRADLKDFVRALSEVLEEVDPYTRHHSSRVAQYAVRLARGMRLREHEIEEIEYAALVHDLGKIGPQHQHILQKPGSLSHEEQRTLQLHPAEGAKIVEKVRALRRAAAIVRTHHERPDGQGYPLGLRGEDVPIGARILNVSDAFDAMTSDRPYRRALSVEVALRELEKGAGTQFDAGVVACMLRMHAAGEWPLLPSPSSEDLRMLRVSRTASAG